MKHTFLIILLLLVIFSCRISNSRTTDKRIKRYITYVYDEGGFPKQIQAVYKLKYPITLKPREGLPKLTIQLLASDSTELTLILSYTPSRGEYIYLGQKVRLSTKNLEEQNTVTVYETLQENINDRGILFSEIPYKEMFETHPIIAISFHRGLEGSASFKEYYYKLTDEESRLLLNSILSFKNLKKSFEKKEIVDIL